MTAKTLPEATGPHYLASVLNDGGVISFDGDCWRIDKAHPEEDMPAELREPLPDEWDDDWLERQGSWWDSLRVCDSRTTEPADLIKALCMIAGVRVRNV